MGDLGVVTFRYALGGGGRNTKSVDPEDALEAKLTRHIWRHRQDVLT
jgi:hypothetical protein